MKNFGQIKRILLRIQKGNNMDKNHKIRKRCKHKWESDTDIQRGSGVDGVEQPPNRQKEVSTCSKCGAVLTRILGSGDDFRHTFYVVSRRIRYPKKIKV